MHAHATHIIDVNISVNVNNKHATHTQDPIAEMGSNPKCKYFAHTYTEWRGEEGSECEWMEMSVIYLIY